MSGMYMGQKAICNNKMHIPAILCLFFTAFASISTNCQVVSEDEETKCTKCRSKLELFLYMLDQENICCIGMPCYMVALLCNFGDVPINLRPIMIPQDYYIRLHVFNQNGDKLKFVGPEIRVRLHPKKELGKGECFIDEINVAKYFDIDTLGRYRIYAEYFDDLWNRKQSTINLESNEISINVKNKSCDSNNSSPIIVIHEYIDPEKRGRAMKIKVIQIKGFGEMPVAVVSVDTMLE